MHQPIDKLTIDIDVTAYSPKWVFATFDFVNMETFADKMWITASIGQLYICPEHIVLPPLPEELDSEDFDYPPERERSLPPHKIKPTRRYFMLSTYEPKGGYYGH